MWGKSKFDVMQDETRLSMTRCNAWRSTCWTGGHGHHDCSGIMHHDWNWTLFIALNIGRVSGKTVAYLYEISRSLFSIQYYGSIGVQCLREGAEEGKDALGSRLAMSSSCVSCLHCQLRKPETDYA